MSPAFSIVPPHGNAGNDAVPSSEVLYVAERTIWGQLGHETVSTAFQSVSPVFWSPGMPKPDLSGWQGDWIISFKSDLILPKSILGRAKKGALNFHPSPPRYRGVGGYWWALHNGDDSYGVTCHHMDERIDHGPIVATQHFPIWPKESEASLRHRSAISSLTLLNITLNNILGGQPLIACEEQWGEHLYTYKELALAQGAASKPVDTKAALKALEAVIKEDFTTSKEDEKHIAANKWA